MKIHIVQKGDTLWKLAKKYGVSFEELKKLNTQLSNPDLLMPGMKLKIPGSAGNVKKEAVKPSQIVHKGVKEAQIPSTPPQVSKEEEQPIMQLKPMVEKQPIMQPKPVEKEQPVVVQKEVPIPEPIIPQAAMANNYTLSMKEMQVTPLPEAKEEVKVPEAPKPPEIPQAPPVQIEAMVQQPIETCIPVTPILPGTGFCYPPPPPIPQQWMYGQCEGGQMNPQVYEESPDVLGEFAMEAPVNANYVAGASMPGMMQTPTFNPYLGGLPQPAQQYDGYESMNMQPSAPLAQPYVQPTYQEESEDCGCSKGSIGTYGPDKGKNPYPQAVYIQPNFSNAPYQQPLPGTPYQPPFAGTQVQPAYEEESEDCGCNKGSIGTYGPDKGKNPYPQAVYTQPSFSNASYQQPQNYSQYQQPLPGTPYQPPFASAQTQPSYQQPGEQAESPYQPPFAGTQVKPSYQQPGEQAESPYQPSFGGMQVKPSYQQPGEQAESPYQPSFGGTQVKPSYQQPGEQAESPSQPSFGGTQMQPSYQQSDEQAESPYQPPLAGTQVQPSYQQSDKQAPPS
ncbi:SafA/ExsA family spore coat assembly protein [Peribacillus sp. Hz7]|uniref:SafA/ExsA family spore coat assembly protein n=1 Tax=Peribacillus sp. Hz7 TaxID=3344873 RepID=UPI0035CACA6D